MNKFEKVSLKQYVIDTSSSEAAAEKEYNNIILPARATKRSCGYDFHSPIEFTLYPGEHIVFPTGIRVLLDDDKCLKIYPRSGLGFKHRLQLDNTVGLIDADYSDSDNEGHIWMSMTYNKTEGEPITIKAGAKIAQGVIEAYYKVDDDTVDAVRNGGFGSTDILPAEGRVAECETNAGDAEAGCENPMLDEEAGSAEEISSGITLYTTHCPKCKILAKKLDAAGIEYEVCDNIGAMEAQGIQSAPILKVGAEQKDYLSAVNWVNKQALQRKENENDGTLC